MKVELLPEGLRICREILLSEYRENPDGLFKVADTLGISRQKLINWLLQAAAEKPELVISTT